MSLENTVKINTEFKAGFIKLRSLKLIIFIFFAILKELLVSSSQIKVRTSVLQGIFVT